VFEGKSFDEYHGITQSRAVQIGSVVSIKVDRRDRCYSHSAAGVVGIAYQVHGQSHVTFKVVTEFGVLSSGDQSACFITLEDYEVRSDKAVLSNELEAIRMTVLAGSFKESEHKKVTRQQAFGIQTATRPSGRNTCRCKKQCTGSCGCVKRQTPCNSSCGCAGRCNNRFNNDAGPQDKE
jgi:hypothetical protein